MWLVSDHFSYNSPKICCTLVNIQELFRVKSWTHFYLLKFHEIFIFSVLKNLDDFFKKWAPSWGLHLMLIIRLVNRPFILFEMKHKVVECVRLFRNVPKKVKISSTAPYSNPIRKNPRPVMSSINKWLAWWWRNWKLEYFFEPETTEPQGQKMFRRWTWSP